MADTTVKDEQPKTPTGEADIRSVVETANAEDENRKVADTSINDDEELVDDDEGDDDGSDTDESKKSDDASGDEDEKDDDEEEKPADKKSQGDRKFTQFAGDGTDDQYISNLEKGYTNSSQEAIRLNTELSQAKARVDSIMRAAASDPELATKLNAAVNGTSDDDASADDDLANPFVKDLETRWKETSEKEITELLDANPQVISDPALGDEVKHWMSVFSNDYKARTGKLMTGGEAMRAAFKYLGVEDKLDKQTLADGAKKLAAPTRPKGSKKKGESSKTEFNSDQLAMAAKMGYSAEKLEKFAK